MESFYTLDKFFIHYINEFDMNIDEKLSMLLSLKNLLSTSIEVKIINQEARNLFYLINVFNNEFFLNQYLRLIYFKSGRTRISYNNFFLLLYKKENIDIQTFPFLDSNNVDNKKKELILRAKIDSMKEYENQQRFIREIRKIIEYNIEKSKSYSLKVGIRNVDIIISKFLHNISLSTINTFYDCLLVASKDQEINDCLNKIFNHMEYTYSFYLTI